MTPVRRRPGRWFVIAAVSLAAQAGCRGDGGAGAQAADRRRATLVIATAAEPNALLPPYAVDLVSAQLCDLLFRRLAEPRADFSTLGDRDYRPALASRWAWGPDSLSVRFTLDSSARWHDGARVTSRDVRFTFDVLTDTSAPPPVGGLARVVDSVTTPDAMTAVVWARRRAPDLFHQLTYATHILPAHLLGSVPHAGLASHRLTRGPVGNGPFRFRAWVPGQQIAFDPAEPPDARSRGPARVLVRVFPDYQAARRALARGDVDVMDYVRPPDIAALSARGDIRILRLPAYTYVVLQFNLRRPAGNRAGGSGTDGPSRGRGATAVSSGHPVFTNVQVRRALAMAIDRRAIVRNLLGDAGAVSAGPFTRAQWTADTSVQAPPFDPAQAERLLDAAGWIRPAAGATRERHGVPLEFSILVPASSATRVTAAVLIQAMLTKIGVRVTVDQREATAALTALERGEFDASLTGYRVDPDPAGVRDAWGGEAARSRQALNYSGYSSAATDDALARAVRETDVTAARAQYRAAYQQILDDAPAVFLYEPTAIVAHAARWHPVGARPDAWWAALRTWTRDPTLDGAP